MAWTEATRQQHARERTRFASDVTDAEWALIAPGLPAAAGCGRPRTTSLRAVVDALFYVLWTGCPCRPSTGRRAIPGGFPPRSTVQEYFYRWRDAGLWEQMDEMGHGVARRDKPMERRDRVGSREQVR